MKAPNATPSLPPDASPWPPSVRGRLLYENRSAAPAAFYQVLQTLISAGYTITAQPKHGADGWSCRARRDAEVSIQWSDTDTLQVCAIVAPFDQVKAEISLLLSRVVLAEVTVI